MTGLAGARAVVTGASRGIGLAIAHGLAAHQMQVVRLARSVRAGGDPAFHDIECDVAGDDAVARAAREILATGPPQVLVNNAGAFTLAPVVETTPEEFRRQMDVNVVGPFLVLRALLPHMAEVGGHVITIGSIADYRILRGNAAYAASKHAVRALHDVVAEEYRGRLRCTMVSPGPTDTPLWDPFEPDADDHLPDRAGMLRPSDVADAVLYAITRPAHVDVSLIRLNPA